MSVMLITLTFLSSTVYASLIINGSFEDNDVPFGSWRWFSSDNVNGWRGSNIEIWDHLGGEQAYHGNQFAELNAHPKPSKAFSIYQDFQTIVGQPYYVQFAYQARRLSKKESFRWEILDLSDSEPSILISTVLEDHTTKGWSALNASFVAESNSSRLQFTTIKPSVFTQGNLLDDVKITAQVAEPSTFLLGCLGLLCMIIARRSQK